MKIIKHINLEYSQSLEFENKIFELTKGYNLRLLLALYNDISFDFAEKFLKLLDENNIKYSRNDFDIEIYKVIDKDLYDRFWNDEDENLEPNLDFIENDFYTIEEYDQYFRVKKYDFLKYNFAHINLDDRLILDNYTIRYAKNQIDIINEMREYYGETLSCLFIFVKTAYDEVYKIDNSNDLKPLLDLSDTTATETKKSNFDPNHFNQKGYDLFLYLVEHYDKVDKTKFINIFYYLKYYRNENVYFFNFTEDKYKTFVHENHQISLKSFKKDAFDNSSEKHVLNSHEQQFSGR